MLHNWFSLCQLDQCFNGCNPALSYPIVALSSGIPSSNGLRWVEDDQCTHGLQTTWSVTGKHCAKEGWWPAQAPAATLKAAVAHNISTGLS